MEFIKTERLARRKSINTQICAKNERNASFKKIKAILRKPDSKRSTEDLDLLLSCADIVKEVTKRLQKRVEVQQRILEIEDPLEDLISKSKQLAKCIIESRHLVIYTGAGISTAARIPDYRGSNGIWTRLQQGKDIGSHDLSLADPTFTHMALSTLYHRGILKYVVSQNCDGLHLRSGLPRSALSELHGNMTIEVCKYCKPNREYWRLFDVTENTARFSHKTMRRCYSCNNALIDTIVHFGERGTLQWPLNWPGACKNADKADTIICLGSSLKVLKKYPWLWQMDKPVKRRPNLYIVNLQWTPKDDIAAMKINGKCDTIMEMVMSELGLQVSEYSRNIDPIFFHATETGEIEAHTKTQPELKGLEVKVEIEEDNFVGVIDLSIKNEINVEIKKEDVPVVESKSPVKDSIFCVDNLLVKDNKKSLNLDPLGSVDNTTAYAFNSLYSYHSNVLSCYNNLQNSFSFLSPNIYPYTTSFLYPGIHSIINPMPFLNCDFSQQLTNQSHLEIKEEIVPKCTFCHQNYQATICLFYQKFESAFVKPLMRFSKIQNREKEVYCECCDYSSESETENSDNSKKVEDEQLENSLEVPAKVQPGWFGKGYRKRRRRTR